MDLQAIEFQTTIHNGSIQVPETYQTDLEGAIVKVIILKPATLQALFKATQALPQVQTITEADIAAEIDNYRLENRLTNSLTKL
ncbi:MAG: hypothetical protein B0A82_02925 [Alkalinema sp. CACIAM 70d]|nr:MAG: hypothetical protein B0A82_02925 [Alkalinema sp. CACIAM 70d]